ncbi:hypothetical protein CQW31_12660 [Pseudomonas sp. 382]|nr:hypothetical protein CQW31_12660 [Pseudomonas sp. 382]
MSRSAFARTPSSRTTSCRSARTDLYRPLRGHARSHRYCTALEPCVVPVGAGVPAKRPAQAHTVTPRYKLYGQVSYLAV